MSKLPSPRTIAVGSVCKATRIASLIAVKRFILFVGNAGTLLLLLLALRVMIEDVDRDRRRRVVVVLIHGRFNNNGGIIFFFINPVK